MPASLAFDACLFDLDGTLVQTAGEMAHALNLTLTEQGMAGAVTPDEVERWVGHGTQALLVQALAHTQASRENWAASAALPAIEAAFDRHYLACCGQRSELYPQVRATLLALRQRGTKLAVVTNKAKRFTHPLLWAHQLSPLLDAVVCGDDVPQKKPDPAGIQLGLAQLGVAPARALFVGDSQIDVAAARNAGIAVWVLPYGYNQGQDIAQAGADRLIPHLGALLAAPPGTQA